MLTLEDFNPAYDLRRDIVPSMPILKRTSRMERLGTNSPQSWG
jgi:hypothetical protein